MRRPVPPDEAACAGRVTLVGAGPGDPELLTLAAVRAIRAATVLLVDDLVGPGVLRYARRSARVIHVGKRGGCASTPQAFIEKLMAAVPGSFCPCSHFCTVERLTFNSAAKTA